MRGIKTFSMVIFTRWGEKIYETTDPNTGWDGKFKGQSCTEAVYTWKIYAKGTKGLEKNLSGTVTLYR